MDSNFSMVLNRYRHSLMEYKTTGNSGFKSQVETDKKWLDDYVRWLGEQSDRQGQAIRTFVQNYQSTNPELVKLQSQIRTVRDQGPKLQNEYETVKQAAEEQDAPLDFSGYYVKAGLILGVLGLIAAVSAF
jgi:hypothetical protein